MYFSTAQKLIMCAYILLLFLGVILYNYLCGINNK